MGKDFHLSTETYIHIYEDTYLRTRLKGGSLKVFRNGTLGSPRRDLKNGGFGEERYAVVKNQKLLKNIENS